METDIYIAFALGLTVGVTLVLTGAGGAIFGVPLLVFGLGIPVAEASPIALLAVAIAASIGGFSGLRSGILRYKAVLVMSTFGLFVSPFGIWVAQHVPNAPLSALFAAVLLYVSLRMYLQAKRELRGLPINERLSQHCKLDETRGKLVWTLPCFRAMSQAGITAGFLSGLLGVGGGFVIVPALKKFTNLPIKSITATSLGVIALISIVGVFSSSIIGSMNWGIGIPFASGTIAGTIGGKSLASFISGPKLQQFFSVVALIVSLSMAYRAFS